MFHFLIFGNTTNQQLHLTWKKRHKHETTPELNTEEEIILTKVRSMPLLKFFTVVEKAP